MASTWRSSEPAITRACAAIIVDGTAVLLLER